MIYEIGNLLKVNPEVDKRIYGFLNPAKNLMSGDLYLILDVNPQHVSPFGSPVVKPHLYLYMKLYSIHDQSIYEYWILVDLPPDFELAENA